LKETAWLSQFPWATLGRREAGSDFLKKCSEQRTRVDLLAKKPFFSLVVSGSDPKTVGAIEAQSYPQWEMIEDVSEAKGDWIGFIDDGDVLSPAALYQFAVDLQAKDFDLIYTNEVLLSAEKAGHIKSFLSKPEFSFIDLIHFNYIGKFWTCRKSVFEALEGFSENLGSEAEHDFLLRLTGKYSAIKHEPFFYYYRKTAPAVANTARLVPVIEQHLKLRSIEASVQPGKLGVNVLPHIKAPKSHKISAVVCFRNKSEWTVTCAKNLARAMGDVPVELLLVNNQSSSLERSRVERGIQGLSIKTQIIDYDKPFNFGNMHNVVLRNSAKGDFIFLLNNDVFLDDGANLDRLVAWAQFPWAGTVGMLLKYPDGRVQHGGFRAIYGGESRMARVAHMGDDPFAFETREVFGNTFAACMMKKETYNALGGLSELNYPNGFGDVSFNFTCVRKGLINIYVGQVSGVHLESASRGLGYEYWEECGIEEEFPEILQQMLRQDLGYNRVPGADFPIKSLLRQAVTQKLFEKVPWLLPWKPRVRKLLKWVPQ
jgi:O-antigen biosynthesis protein